MIRVRMAVLKVNLKLGQLPAAVQCHYYFKLQRLTVRQFGCKRDIVDMVAHNRRGLLRQHDPATNGQDRDHVKDKLGISTTDPVFPLEFHENRLLSAETVEVLSRSRCDRGDLCEFFEYCFRHRPNDETHPATHSAVRASSPGPRPA